MPHAFRSYRSGCMLSGPSFQAACHQDPRQTHLPKPRILDSFQQFKPPVCWVPCWLHARRPAWRHRSQVLFCYCIAATAAIKHRGAVLVVSNKPYFYYPHGGSRDLMLCVKLLTWLRFICMMAKSLARNYKAIKGDLDLKRNQIKDGCFPTNEKMIG